MERNNVPGQKIAEETRRAQILDAAHEVACRYGIDGLTVRRVAEAAGLSHGLVHFHFKSKEALLEALLDRVLATTTAMSVEPHLAHRLSPLEHLLELLQREMARLTRDRRQIQLLFDFWLLGTRHRGIRAKMRAELERYRQAFRPIAEAVMRAEPERFRHVSAGALASMAVAFVKGCAVQSVIDPKGFDVDAITIAANALLAELRPSSR
jgi:TetR/AcrR family transcriptional regulator, transcriptional repressor of bet genes